MAIARGWQCQRIVDSSATGNWKSKRQISSAPLFPHHLSDLSSKALLVEITFVRAIPYTYMELMYSRWGKFWDLKLFCQVWQRGASEAKKSSNLDVSRPRLRRFYTFHVPPLYGDNHSLISWVDSWDGLLGNFSLLSQNWCKTIFLSQNWSKTPLPPTSDWSWSRLCLRLTCGLASRRDQMARSWPVMEL